VESIEQAIGSIFIGKFLGDQYSDATEIIQQHLRIFLCVLALAQRFDCQYQTGWVRGYVGEVHVRNFISREVRGKSNHRS